MADGTLTLTLSAIGGRTVTALQLSNGIGVWDTTSPNSAWLLGVALSLDAALLNNPTTMAVNQMVLDGGSLRLFASDYGRRVGSSPRTPLPAPATLSRAPSPPAPAP